MLELLLYEKNGKCQVIDNVEDIKKHVKRKDAQLLSKGPTHLFYAITDALDEF